MGAEGVFGVCNMDPGNAGSRGSHKAPTHIKQGRQRHHFWQRSRPILIASMLVRCALLQRQLLDTIAAIDVFAELNNAIRRRPGGDVGEIDRNRL